MTSDRGRTSVGRIAAHLAAAAGIGLLIWLLFGGTAFVNYDSAWSLNWMRDLLAGGHRPDLQRLYSPTPHPLSDLLSGALVPLSDASGSHGAVGTGAETALVVLALFWLGALGVVTFRLGEAWFGVGAGIVAAVIVLTREPVLSYGLRTYLDLPYAVFLLLALLSETRRARNGVRTLGWLTLAGLLRPEAWLLAGAYVVYLAVVDVRRPAPTPDQAAHDGGSSNGRAFASELAPTPRERVAVWWGRLDRRRFAVLVAIAAIAPLGWLIEGLVLSGDALQALTGTQQNAADLDRVTGLGSAVTVMPRRLGEIVREPVLLAAFGGGILSLLLLRRRVLLGAAAGVAAALGFLVLAATGLPLLTRYLVFPGTLLILFAAGGLLGWRRLAADDRWRRPWQAFAVVCVLAFVVFLPGQAHRLDRLQSALALQQRVIGDLRVVTGDAVRPALRDDACQRTGWEAYVPLASSKHAEVGVAQVAPDVALPNHRAVPQVLLWLGRDGGPDGRLPTVEALIPDASPSTTLLPTSTEVARGFILDKADKGKGLPAPPRGSVPAGAHGSWAAFGDNARCATALRSGLGR